MLNGCFVIKQGEIHFFFWYIRNPDPKNNKKFTQKYNWDHHLNIKTKKFQIFFSSHLVRLVHF